MMASQPGAALTQESASPSPDRTLLQSLKELGLPEIFLANLALKHCFYLDVFFWRNWSNASNSLPPF
jgi:hypothetical protein